MIAWSLIDKAPVPGGGEELRLWRRGAEFSIRLGVAELMNSRLRASEEALASIPCARLQGQPRARVLIGGLGMGYTFRAALAALGHDATVVVAELSPSVAAWARGPMAELFGESLSDPRASIREVDVRAIIRSEPSSYDAILLDVDNGPRAMTRASNDSLYTARGLNEARRALRRGGILGVWSSGPDEAFRRRFEEAGFGVEQKAVHAHGPNKGARHVLWFGEKSNEP